MSDRISGEELDRTRRDIAEAESLMLRGACKAAGLCLCQTEIEDPGEHIPTCPNVDLDYVPEPAILSASIVVFHCDVCDTITAITRNGGPPPVCCGRLSDAHRFGAVAKGGDVAGARASAYLHAAGLARRDGRAAGLDAVFETLAASAVPHE